MQVDKKIVENTFETVTDLNDMNLYVEKENLTYQMQNNAIIDDQKDIYLTYNLNQDFAKLTHNERFAILNNWKESLHDKFGYNSFSCGEDWECELNEVILKYNEDNYTIDMEYSSSPISLNGEDFEYEKTDKEIQKENIKSEVNDKIESLVKKLYFFKLNDFAAFYVDQVAVSTMSGTEIKK